MNAGMFYTADGGVTWTASDNGGIGTGGWHNVYWDNHHTLCADRVVIGKFYALNSNGRIYVSTDGGAHFSASYPVPADAVTGTWTMESVPGHAGHLQRFGVFHVDVLQRRKNLGNPAASPKQRQQCAIRNHGRRNGVRMVGAVRALAADIQSTRLEIGQVGAGMRLAIATEARKPALNVVLLVSGRA